MTHLEMKAFEGQVNLTLLDDIVGFAMQTAGASYQQKRALQKRCIFPYQNTSASLFQERYGFLYLGELLERYEERFGMTVQDRRAIALALGYTRDIVKDEMFVGSQRTDFIQSIRRSAEDDPYLTGALYLLYEGGEEGLPYESWLKNRQYAQTEELIFVVSLFPDMEQAFQHFRPQLENLLGLGRTTPVLENTGIFKWITAALFPLKKLMKGKSTAPLRALLALPTSFVKEGSKPYECLQKHGYTPLEITYANAMAVFDQWVDNGVRNKSLLSEKIMVALFQTVLEHKDALPAAVYEQLTGIYTVYTEFEIKCYEVRRLSDTLKCVRIKNPETMVWFIGRTFVLHPANGSFDIMDSKWDVLATRLNTDMYSQLFEASLTEKMDAAGLRQRIGRYDKLTGKSYLDRYSVSQGGYCFSLLVKAGIFDLWTEFQASIDLDGVIVKEGMLHHIGRYIRNIQTPQAFEFLKKFMPQYGYPGLKTYFEGFSDGFSYQLWKGGNYRGDDLTLTIERDFLKDDPAGRLLLLHWVEEYFFLEKPENHLLLIQTLLENEAAAGLLPPKEQRKLFDLFIGQKGIPAYMVSQLKQQYLTPEELQADQDAKEAAELEEQRQQHNELVQSIQKQYADSTSFKSAWEFMDNFRYYQEKENIAAHTIYEGLDERLRHGGYVLKKKECSFFLRVCAKLIKLDVMTWAETQTYIMKIKEVIDNDPSNDSTG